MLETTQSDADTAPDRLHQERVSDSDRVPGVFLGDQPRRVQPHDSAALHVSGRAIYVDDMPSYPNELQLALVLSEHAHARINAIDTQAALAAPGVLGVLTAADVPGKLDIGPVFPGDPLLVGAEDRVEFYGQPLALVLADDLTRARQAAARVSVDYHVLEPVLDIQTALRDRLFVTEPHRMRRGEPEQAIAASSRQLSGEFYSGGQDHFYLEGQVALALPQEDGGMLVYSSTQNPTEMQKLIADVLGVPMMQVTVETRRMGGGFGGKETQSAQTACLAALAAKLSGRPARLRLPRAVDMVSTGKRHDFYTRYRIGFDDSGVIRGVELELAANCGYSPDLSAAIVDRALFHSDNCYFFENVSAVGYPCKTHTVSNTAFRGFGGPQGMLVAEQLIEAVARDIGCDPLTVRRRNLYGKPGSGREQTHYYQTVEDNIIDELIDELADSADYDRRRREIAAFNQASPVLKRGIALTPVKFGISFTATHLNQAGALVHVYHDGSVHLNHGGTEMGQGLFIKVAQIVAEELQINVNRVQISATRTDKVPNTSPTAASAGTDLNGMAALYAAREIKRRLTAFAAQHFGVTADDVSFIDDHIVIKIAPGEQRLGFDELAHLAYMNRVGLSATGFYRTPKVYYDRNRARGRPFYYYAYGAACSEVIIDTLTGEHRLLRADLLHDVGRSLNPAIDLGQVEGGFIQGLGWLTSEELAWNEHGKLLTDGPATYKIPAVSDTPPVFNVRLAPDRLNLEDTVYRSKAVGEPPFMLAISVWSALKDALSSLSDYRTDPPLNTPATPERMLAAVLAAETRGASGSTPE